MFIDACSRAVLIGSDTKTIPIFACVDRYAPTKHSIEE